MRVVSSLAVAGMICISSWGGPLALARETTGLQGLTRQELRAVLERKIEQRREAIRSGQHTGSDITPPDILGIDALGPVDMAKAGAVARVNFRLADDLSGVKSLYGVAYGPAGHSIAVAWEAGRPLAAGKMVATSYGVENFDFLVPGIYRYGAVFLTDEAGNGRIFDEAELAALGNSSFVVKNKSGYDSMGPTLLSGKILTKTVRLSDTHPGTDGPVYAAVNLTMSDSGQTATSGPAWAMLYFCLIDSSSCMGVGAQSAATQGISTLTLGHQLQPGADVPGEYILAHMFLRDVAGNYAYYDSVLFGGSTDFSNFFPSTSIVVLP